MIRDNDDSGRVPSTAEQLADTPLFGGSDRVPAPWSTEHVPPPRARNTDPQSSHEAAERAFASAKDQEKWILACLRGRGPHGATGKEIAETLGPGWTNVVVGRRIAALREVEELVSFDGKKHHGIERPELKREGCCIHVAIVSGKVLGDPPEFVEWMGMERNRMAEGKAN